MNFDSYYDPPDDEDWQDYDLTDDFEYEDLDEDIDSLKADIEEVHQQQMIEYYKEIGLLDEEGYPTDEFFRLSDEAYDTSR